MSTEHHPNASRLLDAHHYERTREHAAGAAIVSVITGQRRVARQVFGTWATDNALPYAVAARLAADQLHRQL
ncbi:MAG: hypothetical protein AAFX85_06785, partial [Pseudomonadota bacterium]